MELSKNAVSTLNDLIETSKNGEEGFRLAAQHAHDPQLKSILQKYADDCGSAVRELQQAVAGLGGKPETTGTVAGKAHRAWVKLREAVTKDDDQAILDEVERGEDHAKAIYQKALKDTLPSPIREIVQKQYEGTLQHHDRIRDLRNAHERVH